MIFFSNDKFKKLAGSEIKKIYEKIEAELCHIPSYMMPSYYNEENNKIISFCPIFNNKKKIVGHSVSIKNDNNNQYAYAISYEEMFELILVDNNENICEKYKIELENDNLISTRSLFVHDDYLMIQRNITKNKIDLSGTILDHTISPRKFLKDDMDYLKYCFEHYNLSHKTRKRVES